MRVYYKYVTEADSRKQQRNLPAMQQAQGATPLSTHSKANRDDQYPNLKVARQSDSREYHPTPMVWIQLFPRQHDRHKIGKNH